MPKLRKTILYIFTGHLGKPWAGSRPLTDKERHGLLIGMYGLAAQVLYYMWREDRQLNSELDTLESLHNQLDILREENRRLVRENQVLSRTKVELHNQLLRNH